MDEGEIAVGELVESGEDAAIVFQHAEQDLDLVSFLVERPVGLTSVGSPWVGRDDGGGVLVGDPVEDGVAVIGAIGEEGLGVDTFEQRDGLWRIAELASRQREADRVAQAVGDPVDLGREAAA